MKMTYFFLFLIIPIIASSQNNKFNTDINTANKVIIINGTTTIKKVEKLITYVYIDNGLKIRLDTAYQKIDTNGVCFTYLHLINPYSNIYNVNLEFEFDTKVDTVLDKGLFRQWFLNWNTTRTNWILDGEGGRSSNGATLIFKSKEKINSMKITGLAKD